MHMQQGQPFTAMLIVRILYYILLQLECGWQILWQSIQRLSWRFIWNNNCQPNGGVWKKSQGIHHLGIQQSLHTSLCLLTYFSCWCWDITQDDATAKSLRIHTSACFIFWESWMKRHGALYQIVVEKYLAGQKGCKTKTGATLVACL